MRSQMFPQSKVVNPAESPAALPAVRARCLDVAGRLLGRGGGGHARSLEAVCMTGKRVLISRNKGGQS